MTPSDSARPQRCNVEVDRLRCSGALTRGNILITVKPTRAEYYAVDQWLAPLHELVEEKLAAEFGPGREGRPTVAVRGSILAFQQVDVPGGAEAHIKLALLLTLDPATDEPARARKRIYEIRLPAAERTPSAVVEALSEGLERLAQRIAEDADAMAEANARPEPGPKSGAN
jgi:ABC-type uncharacterized transport system auxiliary subunit